LKIQLLKKRENFLEIFKESIEIFFKEQYLATNKVKVKYILNDNLNIVYPSKINREELRELVREFEYHPNIFRKFFQRIYCYVAIRPLFELLTGSEKLEISIPSSSKKKWVFIPGNHSIRVVDLEKNRCFVFLKFGFNKEFLQSDANIRLKYKWLKTPKVFQLKETWYEEERVVGLPWNRLSSINLKKQIIIKAEKQLAKLYQKTNSKINIKKYIPQLCKSILSTLGSFLLELPDKEKYIIRNFVREVNLKLTNSFGDVNIDLVITHGDFQPGNILCSKKDFWIIDWEYSNQRSIFYDALVFDLDCRFSFGLAKRLNKKIKKLANKNDYLKWTGQSLNNKNSFYLYVFFLEDLLLRINEVSTESIKNKSEILSSYLTEISKVQKILIKNIKNYYD